MDNEFAARRNPGRMKFGYKPHPTDSRLMVPDEAMLAALDEAFSYVRRGYSLRDVSNWLFAKCGVRFDFSALRKAYLRTRKEKHGRKPRLTVNPSNTGSTDHGPDAV